MKINVIATGSAGNLYELVDKDGNSMLIEAGVPRATYVKHRIGKTPPEMCIISHSHSDHAQYKGEFQAVTPTYLAKVRNVSEHWKAFGIGLNHGDARTATFLIKSLVEKKFLYFATDIQFDEECEQVCEVLRDFGKIENFLIECNYNDYLFHLATDEQRLGCSRHLSDNDVVNFIRKTGAKNPKIITIHGSNRLSADTYTKKYLSSKLITSTVDVAVGAKGGQRNIFII
jgi:Cft2 family RNA processing exonuclease